MWRDRTSHQKPVTTNEWLELTVVTFELFWENHLPGMIRGTKSGRTSSGMDAQEGGIVTSSHVTEFTRGHPRSPADYTDFSFDNRHWFRIKWNWESNAANDGVRHLMDIKRVKPDENTEARHLYDAQNNYFYNILQINVKGGKAKVILWKYQDEQDVLLSIKSSSTTMSIRQTRVWSRPSVLKGL